ncbi:MAG: hypothetical protein V3G42_00015 [Oscillospiraceae bacterium]
MKEYKMITLKTGWKTDSHEQPSSVSERIKNMFFAENVGNMQVSSKKAEQLMQKMNQEGWEVVSVAPVASNMEIVFLLMTFEREIQ